MKQSIPIADKDTLDAVLDKVSNIESALNNSIEGDDLSSPSGNNMYLSQIIAKLDSMETNLVSINNNSTISNGKLDVLQEKISNINETISIMSNQLDTLEKKGGIKGVPLNQPSNYSVEVGDECCVIKWTDPEDLVINGVSVVSWKKTVLVRKIGSSPTDINDGEIILESTIRDQYKTEGYIDDNMSNGSAEYYYGIFPCSNSDVYTYGAVGSATPTIILPDKVTGVTMTNLDEEVRLSFTVPATGVTEYKVVYNTEHYPETLEDGTLVESFVKGNTITGLTNDIVYYFTIFTINAKGRINGYNIEFTPTAILPEAPTVLYLENNDEEVKITYLTGNGGITSKLVYNTEHYPETLEDGINIDIERSSLRLTTQVDGLTNDIMHYFTLFNINEKGRASRLDKSITPTAIYPNSLGTPTNIVFKADQITFDKISSIVDYAIVYCIAGETTPSEEHYDFKSDKISYSIVNPSYTFTELERNTVYTFAVYAYDNKIKRPLIGDTVLTITTAPIEVAPFKTATNEVLKNMIEAHYNGIIDISEQWSIGDSRAITLNPLTDDISTSYGEKYNNKHTQNIRIIDFSHDDLVTPINGINKACITVDFENPLYNRTSNYYFDGVKKTCTNEDNYITSNRRSWLNNQFYDVIEDNFKLLIKSVYKKCYITHNTTDYTIDNSEDYIFLPSCLEVLDITKYTGSSYSYDNYKGFANDHTNDEGYIYEFYKNNSPIKRRSDDGNSYYRAVWFRSPAYDSSSKYGIIGTNNSNGRIITYWGYDSDTGYASPAFCL